MIDRALQRQLLERLAESYPERCRSLLNDIVGEEKPKIANLLYLQEHDLVDAGLKQGLSGDYGYLGSKITAKGLDFLADDGGLTAVLGTVTVKLHAETIRDLLEAKILSANIPPEEKSRLVKQLGNVGSEALKAITKRLVEKGIENLPDAAQWLHAMLA